MLDHEFVRSYYVADETRLYTRRGFNMPYMRLVEYLDETITDPRENRLLDRFWVIRRPADKKDTFDHIVCLDQGNGNDLTWLLLEHVTKEEFKEFVTKNKEGFLAGVSPFIPKEEKKVLGEYLLTATDGYSIEHTFYPTLAKAQGAMNEYYEKSVPDDWKECWKDQSCCNEMDAILFTGENVYVWDIIPLIKE